MSVSPVAMDTYRVVLSEPRTGRVVCDISAGKPQLPTVEIGSSDRIAESLCRNIRESIGVRTLLLWVDRQLDPWLGVFECVFPDDRLMPGLAFLPSGVLEEILPTTLHDRIKTSLLQGLPDRGYFSRPGWLTDFVKLAGLGKISDVEHINSGIGFCLLKLTTADAVLWLKAVGFPNTQEFANTMLLSELAPKSIPQIVFTLPECNAWLARHIPGPTLNDSDDSEVTAALAGLASLQIDMIPFLSRLRSIGVDDFSTELILRSLPELFEVVRTAMAAQTSSKVTPLSDDVLKILQQDCTSMLERFSRIGIPDTIVHGDIGHGNVLFAETGVKFLDWAEGWIAHPFVGAEILLTSLRNGSRCLRSETELRSAYYDPWRDLCEAPDFDWAQRYAPALGALVYAMALNKKSIHCADSKHHWPLLRSLLRDTLRLLRSARQETACTTR